MTKAVLVPKETADIVIRELLAHSLIRKDLKIRKLGDHIAIPVNQNITDARFKMMDLAFEPRYIEENPIKVINHKLQDSGIKTIVPEKWVRYGSAVVFRQFPGCWDKSLLHEISGALKAKKIYIMTGPIVGKKREPKIRLAYGRHGSIVHLENGIKYIFDPEKIMFSPGNVNERTDMENLRVEDGIIFDMFCGIGYFSLPLAKYSGCREIVCTDINPLSISYLKKSAKLNGLTQKIKAVNKDCRQVYLKNGADLIVMGNFDSFEYIDHALLNLKNGGNLLIHFLLSTNFLKDADLIIQQKFKGHNVVVGIKYTHIVKSYSPNIWHMSSLLEIHTMPE